MEETFLPLVVVGDLVSTQESYQYKKFTVGFVSFAKDVVNLEVKLIRLKLVLGDFFLLVREIGLELFGLL